MLSILAIVCVWVNDLPLGWRLGVTIPFGLWLLYEIIFFGFNLDGLEKIPDEELPAKCSKLSKKEAAAKLEALEENLGCPADVVLKALTQGVYAKYKQVNFLGEQTGEQGIGKFYVTLERNYDGLNSWYLTSSHYNFDEAEWWALKDYGKTWAFTREELE